MNLFAKISLLIWIIVLIAAAIMFDWFGSRDLAYQLLDSTENAVMTLEETGDHMQDAIDVVKESAEPAADEAAEAVRDRVE